TLSIERCLWLARSIAGCDGAGPRRAGPDPRASSPRRRASISRRRCPALVASAGGPRRAHPFFRRLSLVAVRHLPLRLLCRRYGRARRTSPFPRRAPRHAGRGIVLRFAKSLPGIGHALPALRARDRARIETRRARFALDGLRRLEGRAEPRRKRRPGRKRLAR